MLVPATILSATTLLLVDNITYTLFRMGIITSQGALRVVYAGGFIALIVYFINDLDKLSKKLAKSPTFSNQAWTTTGTIILAGIMSLIVLAVFFTGILLKAPKTAIVPDLNKRKNVVLITADGLNSQQMSAYEYNKETTPFLEQMTSSALISQNNFSNSGSTAGSITSILTGKFPTSTRVLYRPDILRGEDAYQSLPTILKAAGYYTAQYSFGFYADAYQLNFKNAFDYVNGRTAEVNSVLGIKNFPVPTDYEYFLYELQNRLISRLKHIFLVESMQNEYQQVTDPIKYNNAFDDREKIEQAIDLLSEATQPVFLHIHWMKSHGPRFNPRNRAFSAGMDITQQKEWSLPFYEDVVLDFDEDIRFLYSELDKAGVVEDTLIIIGSDHGMGFVTSRRIPLIMLFPNSEHSGELVVDTQNLDIAPTVLDYLKIGIPNWMEGHSLLHPLDSYRPIFGVRTGNTVEVEGLVWVVDEKYNNPPFYQFDYIGIENCGIWTQLNLEDLTWSSLPIVAYESACSLDDILDSKKIHGYVIERLKQDGFDFNETQIPSPQLGSK